MDKWIGGLMKDRTVHKLWAMEALRRRDEVRSGRVKTIPAHKALIKVRKIQLRSSAR